MTSPQLIKSIMVGLFFANAKVNLCIDKSSYIRPYDSYLANLL